MTHAIDSLKRMHENFRKIFSEPFAVSIKEKFNTTVLKGIFIFWRRNNFFFFALCSNISRI